MKRAVTVLTTIVLAAAMLGGTVQAQDQLSDAQRLELGIQQCDNQQFAEAIRTLEQIDPENLSAWNREKPEQFLRRARAGLARQQTAGQAMAAGESAATEGQYRDALQHFESAREADHLPADSERRLDSLIRVARQGADKQRRQVIEQLAEARRLDRAGRIGPALRGYRQVLASDVALNDADRAFVAHRVETLSGDESAVAATPVAATIDIAQADTGDEDLAPIVTPQNGADAEPVEAEPIEAEPIEIDSAATQTYVEETTTEPARTTTDDSARVQGLLEQAEAAMNNENWPAAKMYYQQALALDPNNARAEAGLARAQGLLGQGPKSLLEREGSRIDVAVSRTVAQVRDAMAKARAIQANARQPRDFNDAFEQLNYANRLINQNQYLSPERAESLREEVYDLRSRIEQAKGDMIATEQAAQQQETQQRVQTREQLAEEQRRRKIDQLWRSAEEYAAVREYDKAGEVLDQLLVVDPQNERARRFRDEYLYFAGLKESIDVRTLRRKETRQALVDTEDAAIPYTDLVVYPSAREWEELTRKRQEFVESGTGMSEAAQEAQRKLHTKGIVGGEDWSINLQMQQAALSNVLDFIAEAARAEPREINIIIDRRGIEDAGLMLDEPIDLDLKDVSVGQALKYVLGQDLGYRVQEDGSVVISARSTLNQNLPVRTYFVRDLITQVPDFGQTVPRMNLEDLIGQTGESGGGGVSIFEETFEEEEGVEGTERLKELIERTVKTDEMWEALGGNATIDFYEKSGLMIVSQTPDGHERIGDLLENLRRERAIMISIEARFITVTDAFLNDVTLDFDVAFLDTPDKFLTNPSGDDEHVTGDQDYDTLPGFYGAEQSQPILIGNTMSNGRGVATLLPNLSNIAGFDNFAANEGGMIISGTFLDDLQVGFLIRAIQADRRSNTLFAPRITLWNGQRAWISDGTHYSYVSELTPIVAEAAVGFEATISTIVSGTVLDVMGTVSADRRYVQLDLRPQVALPPEFETVSIQAAAIMTASAEIMLPTIRMTQINTSVSVPDGGTLLIGGVKMFEEHDVETGVPVLSKVPVLKRAFSNRAQVRGSQNLLILVKPSIIIQSEKEAEIGV